MYEKYPHPFLGNSFSLHVLVLMNWLYFLMFSNISQKDFIEFGCSKLESLNQTNIKSFKNHEMN